MASKQQRAQTLVDHYTQLVADLFGMTAPHITVNIADIAAAGQTSGTHITLDKDWDPRNVGTLVFEISNAVLQAKSNPQLGHPIPGAADTATTIAMANFARYQLAPHNGAGPAEPGWTPDPGAERLIAAYRQNPNTVHTFAADVSNGTARLRDLNPENDAPGTVSASPYGPNMSTTQGYAHGGATNPDGSTQDAGGGGIDTGPKTVAEILAAMKGDQKANFRAFLYTAQGLGLNTADQDIIGLAQEASKKGYDQGTFMFYLRQRPEYHAQFPGIFAADGTMKMSEDQYITAKADYKSIAAQAGLPMTDKMIAWLFHNDVSADEYRVKAPAAARLQRDPQLFDAYKRELVQSGAAKPGEVTKDGMLKAILGMGNKAWKDVWQDAVTRNAAIDSGIAIKKHATGYASLGQGAIEKISGKGLSEEAMSSGFAALSEALLTGLPMSKIQGYGLSKQDLVAAAFGGKGSARTRQLVQHIADQEKVFYEDRATTATESLSTGGMQTAAPRPQV